MTFTGPFTTPFARVSSMAEAIRRRKAQKESERVALAQLPRIRVGVCAMDKKAQSKPMQAILKRMNLADEFDIVIFGDDVILNKPVEEWPLCQVLLTWHSTGFPLQKAQQYVQLRNPILINDVHQQPCLLDRRDVYSRLKEHNVPTPQHIVVNRTAEQAAAGEDPEGFVETPDYVAQGDVKLSKPFVEKPAAADNHNVWIYYPHSMGGGVKMMFRKVGNKSADYDSEHPGTVRRDGSYIYEEFIATSGTDIKVYTVGSEYAHAEARKSPVVDGKVQRATDGKEIRFPVLLTPQEKEVASIVVQAFRQRVCGFDLLRTDSGQSYVCDVNGWSFVKNSHKYYEDAARILRHTIFQEQSPGTLPLRRPLPQLTLDEELPDCLLPDMEETPEEELEKAEMIHVRQLQAEIEHTNKVSLDRELLCVLAVVRHGDRTPKHKLKLTVSNQPFLDVFSKYKDSKGRQAKLKAPAELEAFLEAVLQVLPAHYADGIPPETPPEGGAAMGLPAHGAPTPPSPAEGGVADPVRNTSKETPIPTPETLHRPQPESPVPTGNPAASMVTTGTLAAAETLPHTPRTPPHSGQSPFPISQSTDDGAQAGASGAHSGAAEGAEAEPDAAESETAQLAIIRRVLRAGNHFSGINRKVQLKPVGYAEDGSVSAIQVIVKWGGVLTHLGRRQSEELGNIYRMVMYPNSSDGGLLRLHSTYRHDLKIYSSDEGRVQTSAAAFAKGLLDLEGDSLTPVLVSLVKKDAAMLDAFGKGASEDIRRTKEELYRALTRDPETGRFHCKTSTDKMTTLRSLPVSPNRSATSLMDNASVSGTEEAPFVVVPHAPDQPLAKLRALYEAIKELLFHLRKHVWHASAFSSERQFSVLNTSDYKQSLDDEHVHRILTCSGHLLHPSEAGTDSEKSGKEDLSAPYGTESMLMMWDRWKKLEKAFYNSEADQFDISKIPDIYDSIKFDCIHNSHLDCDYSKVFPIAKELADCVIPAEYGVSAAHKLRIAKKIAAELIGKLLVDLENSRHDCEADAYDATGGHPAGTTPATAHDHEPISRSTPATSEHVTAAADVTPLPPASFAEKPAHVDGAVGEDGGVAQGAEQQGEAQDIVSSEDVEDEEQEDARVHVLAPFTRNVNSIKRHVRTRIYFTSESHIHSLMNILRHTELEGRSLLSEEALERFAEPAEFDYLTQIVFRLYECNNPPHEGSRFQVEIQFSNGANYDPRVTKVMNDKPRENVQRSESVPLGEFRDHLSPWGSQSKAATMPASVLSTAMGPNNSSQTHLPASGPRSSSVAKSVSDPGGSIENM